MKPINEIIDAVTSSSPDISTALLKTKVLLHKLGQQHLSSWVDSELKGYASGDQVPDYRIASADILGTISNGAYRYAAVPIPLGKRVPESARDNLRTCRFTQSISAIEFLGAGDDTGVQCSIPPELYPYMSDVFKGGYYVERAWQEPPSGFPRQIVTEVRTRLLDFLLVLSNNIPDGLEENELGHIQEKLDINNMFHNAIFGDGATIIIGDRNIQNVSSDIRTNDFESLAKFLESNNVAKEHVVSLKQAMEADEGSPEHARHQMGKEVSRWLKATIEQAGTTSWDITVGIASNLLTTALHAYYGW
jgi:hypothetical protein